MDTTELHLHRWPFMELINIGVGRTEYPNDSFKHIDEKNFLWLMKHVWKIATAFGSSVYQLL